MNFFCLNMCKTPNTPRTPSEAKKRQPEPQQDDPQQVKVDQQSRLKLARWYAEREQFNKAFSQYWRILNTGD
jgi:hypothetical protein